MKKIIYITGGARSGKSSYAKNKAEAMLDKVKSEGENKNLTIEEEIFIVTSI